MNTPTKDQLKAALSIVAAIGDGIRTATKESPLRGIPSGHLYAMLMNRMDFVQYEKCINILKNAGLVREDVSHLLVWIGPELKEGGK